ncbi:hypothetical protein [Tropicimonas marinistellae]|uniref:hypothetical protein n=1 Tax=Tropicimonas marinistellae TaxID=1739787 RepID=UPI00082DBEF2|nr:hypothetical protein [Tropicimonas marinistellae]
MTRQRALSLLLVLSLGLSALGFGMARGQAPAAGQMVICTGHGIVTVTLDSKGNPVESVTLCPDAAMSFWAVTALSPPEIPPVALNRTWRDWPRVAAVIHASTPRNRSARAPPA